MSIRALAAWRTSHQVRQLPEDKSLLSINAKGKDENNKQVYMPPSSLDLAKSSFAAASCPKPCRAFPL